MAKMTSNTKITTYFDAEDDFQEPITNAYKCLFYFATNYSSDIFKQKFQNNYDNATNAFLFLERRFSDRNQLLSQIMLLDNGVHPDISNCCKKYDNQTKNYARMYLSLFNQAEIYKYERKLVGCCDRVPSPDGNLDLVQEIFFEWKGQFVRKMIVVDDYFCYIADVNKKDNVASFYKCFEKKECEIEPVKNDKNRIEAIKFCVKNDQGAVIYSLYGLIKKSNGFDEDNVVNQTSIGNYDKMTSGTVLFHLE